MAYCRINSHICSSSSSTHNKPFLARKLQSRALTGSFSKAKSWLPNSAGSSGSPHLYRPDLRLHNISCSIGFKSKLSAPERGSARGFSTLYELLEIEKDVGFAEIKSAYRKMARRYHPDVWPASHKEQSAKLFLMVHEAYDTLSDPAKRAHYDHQLLLHDMNCHGPAGRSSIKGGAATTIWSQWEAQVAALKYRRRSAVMTESWGSRMRSASNHGRPDSSPL